MKILEAMRKLDEGLIMINLKNKTVFKKEGEQILAKRYKDDDFLSEYKDEWRKVSYIETDGEWIEATVIDSSIQNAISRRFK